MNLGRDRKESTVWYAMLAVGLGVAIWSVKDWNWSVVWDSRVALTKGLVNSLQYSLAALLTAFPFATLLALARNYGPRGLSILAMLIVDLLRTVPQVIILLWVFFVAPEITGLSISAQWAGYLGLSLIAVGYMSEVIRAGISSVSRHQWETGYAVGLSWAQTCAWIILPQALRNMLPALIAISVMTFKTTTLLYVIGVVDFFRAATLANIREIEPQVIFLLVAVVYFVLCYIISMAIRKLDPKYQLVE